MLDQDLSEEGFPNSQQGFSSEIELRRRILWRKGVTVEFSRLSGCGWKKRHGCTEQQPFFVGNICHQVYRQVVKEIRQR